MSLEDLLGNGTNISNLMKVGLSGAQEISLDLIDIDPEQPRKDFDKDGIKALSQSIKLHGLLQPISVRGDKMDGILLIMVNEDIKLVKWRV
jgi:ParB family chromosome partitioning protein